MKNKVLKNIIIVMTFLLIILNINNSYAYEQVAAYNLKVRLKNINTTAYTIELLDGEDKVYSSQKGNDSKEHEFIITGTAENTNLENFKVKIRYNNGKIKTFENIKMEELKENENANTEIKDSYIYNLRVNIISIPTLIIIIIVVAAVGIIVYLKTHKKRIK